MLPDDGRSITQNSLIKHTCSWHDELIVFQTFLYFDTVNIVEHGQSYPNYMKEVNDEADFLSK